MIEKIEFQKIDSIKNEIYLSEILRSFREHVKCMTVGEPLTIRGVAGSLLSLIAQVSYEEHPRQILLVTSDLEQAEKLRDDCAILMGEESVLFYGAHPKHQLQLLDSASSLNKIETLKALTSGKNMIVVASPASLAEKVPSPGHFTQSMIELVVNEEYNFQALIERLEQNGFERKGFVEGYGDFAVRGGIIDVFPFIGENPLRFEFWGNKVESIREFDVLSQRSIRELQGASIVPSLSTTAITDEEQIENNGGKGGNLSASIFDYLHASALVILDNPLGIESEINKLHEEGVRNLFSFNEISQCARNFLLIMHDHNISEKVEGVIDFQSRSQPSFNSSVNALVESLGHLFVDGYRIYMTCDTNEEAVRLQELIEEVLTLPHDDSRIASHESIDPSGVIEYKIIPETLHSGFIFPSARLAVFTEHEIFNRLKRRGTVKRRRFKGFSQKELHQLKSGDYVVHIDYGIGMFDGLTKISVSGNVQEVMKLRFVDNDVLYVNLNFVSRVQRYSSRDGHVPKLSKLGTPDWDRIKGRAKRRIKDIARDLIALYAKRKHEKGFRFSADTHWQKELEASFIYEDTPDQANAALEVKRDMENLSPMDRLICGDVGFGKTEVAVRAAFKAVMSGKQVALLVPTTILAMQHFQTFVDRLSRYTTRIENITRFKSTKDQKKIVENLASGSVDIIIGTHRLLSKDIRFKDLGLLIIDEEHRFGVSAKERLRKLKATVDTLALTATPIPRTLHFSLIGARDLSMITTPPRNRLPIITEIIPASEGRRSHWQVVREAILKELHRDGQVYFVHDRVQNIGAIADQLKSHCPEARVHIAHGQMPGHQLEKAMLNFLEKKYDVLVCTKIIESGLDIPNVNTIIINRADQFGLAELYQLRGRVGRANLQAFAYLLVPPLNVLPKQTLRRLQAIEEFTELGSGFNLAMRDLEIRGAGNIFGAEQSGFIIEMGFETYERIVREAVEELYREEYKDIYLERRSLGAHKEAGGLYLEPQTIIEYDIAALIPDFYIEADNERLDIYRRLYRISAIESLQPLREELQDRFGEYPEEVENLFQLIEIRIIASRIGFPKVSLKEGAFIIGLPDQSDVTFYGVDNDPSSAFEKITRKISEDGKRNVQFKQSGKTWLLEYSCLSDKSTKDYLREAKEKLVELRLGCELSN